MILWVLNERGVFMRRLNLVASLLFFIAVCRAGDDAALPRSSPEKQGISSAEILAFIEKADKEIDQLHSFMLVRHGHVVAEGWWGPYDAKTPHILFSLSKSFTSTAVGMAIAEGKFSIDDEVVKFFPEDVPADASANLKAMRVRDLLRMNTGHQSETPIWRDTPKDETSWTKRFFSQPVQFKPGTRFVYNSPATYMLSAIVQKTTGMNLVDYLKPRLFEPLGIDTPYWVASPQGISAGAYGMLVKTEDIARFGQLYLQKGNWKGKQLVPAEWVAAATSLQTSNGSNPKSDWDQGYGYQFWRCRPNCYRGDGAFGQYCIVVPELDAVIAITAGVRDMQTPMNHIWDKLLPAMKKDPLPEEAAAKTKLDEKLASLTMKLPAGQPKSALAEKVSGKWYEFPENERGIKAIALDFKTDSPAILVRTASGETKTPLGVGAWIKSRGGFANGLEKSLSVPPNPGMAAAGAWSADDVFTVKLTLTETPFYTTMSFKFDGERLEFDSNYNVAFGPTKLAQLIGQSAPAK
jgi:CubicO group peptidase (beta-lactamase class C family)